MPKAKTKQPTTVATMERKQKKQDQMIEQYKNQRRWITWAACIILVLLFLFTSVMGYATNWWQDPTKTSTLNATPTASTDTSGTGSTDASTQNGTTTTGGSTKTNTNTNSDTTHATSTTNSTTSNNTTSNTTNTSTTTNNDTTTPSKTGLITQLQQFYDDLNVGGSLNDAITQAQNLGISYSCETQLLTIRVCTFTQGGQTVTLKSLLGNDSITGLSTTLL